MKGARVEHIAVWMMMIQTAVIVAAVVYTNFRFDITPGDLLRKLDAVEAKVDIAKERLDKLQATN